MWLPNVVNYNDLQASYRVCPNSLADAMRDLEREQLRIRRAAKGRKAHRNRAAKMHGKGK